MRVFRYERDGRGPYTYTNPNQVRDYKLVSKINTHCDWSAAESHPSSDQDGLPWQQPCAFDSIDALRTWFDGVHGSLVRCGFRVRVYEVPAADVRVGYSGKQVTFNPDAVVRVIR